MTTQMISMDLYSFKLHIYLINTNQGVKKRTTKTKMHSKYNLHLYTRLDLLSDFTPLPKSSHYVYYSHLLANKYPTNIRPWQLDFHHVFKITFFR